MSQILKQSTAFTFQLGPFVDSTDGVTPKTSLTIAATDVDISKGGAAYADKHESTALTGTGDAQGYYDCVLDTTDTGTLGPLDVRCYVSTALPVWQHFMIVPANVWDSLFGADYLQVDLLQILGTTLTESAGQIAATFKKFFNVATPTGTANSLPDAVPGAAGGVFIAGSNAATTITSAAGSALTLTSSGANGSGLNASGNGSGDGIKATGGATGAGMRVVGGATSGAGLYATAGGASNYGIEAVGAGATDSGGIKATATTAGEGFEGRAAGNGHGMILVGAGSGEGLHATAGGGANGHGAHFEGVGANSHGALFSRGGSGGDDMAFATNDVTVANVTTVGTVTNVATVATVTNAVLISSGSGAGQLDITSGVVKANLAQILGTVLTEGAGQIAAAFKKFFNVAAPTGTVNSLPDAVAGAVNGLAIVGSAMTLAADQAVNATKISGSTTAADNLEASALAVVTGTAVTGTLSTTAFTTSLTEATDNHYNGRVCVFTSGVLAGQAKAVIDYDGASKLLTTRAFTEAPSNLDAFVLV